MGRSFLRFLLLYIFTCSSSPVQSHEDGFITVEISNKGLDLLKDLLIENAKSSFIPLVLPTIQNSVKFPILGSVEVTLFNTTMERIDVTSSTLRTGETGIVLYISGATANLTMNWEFSYTPWLLPITVSDKGNATVRVEGLEVGFTIGLETQQGSLKLSLLECGCYVTDVYIKLDGGASWFYQGLVDTFEGKITSAVEDAVSKKITESIIWLDSVVQSLPKEVSITDIATLNTTFIDDPELGESFLGLEINGLLSAKDEVILSSRYHILAPFSCKEGDKMVKISLHEYVIKSALSVYFEAGQMHWVVDKVFNQSLLLNTVWWRFIIPKLYKMYPNEDMYLDLSASSLPDLEVGKQQIKAIIPLDMVIGVLDVEELIPVISMSMAITASISGEISKNVVAGSVKLRDFTMSLNWSKVGPLHMNLIRRSMHTFLETVILPYINLKLRKGYHLPVFHGYKLDDARIHCADSWLVVCSDVTSVS